MFFVSYPNQIRYVCSNFQYNSILGHAVFRKWSYSKKNHDRKLDDSAARYKEPITFEKEPRQQSEQNNIVSPRIIRKLYGAGCRGNGCFNLKEAIGGKGRKEEAPGSAVAPVLLPLLDSLGCRGSQCFGKRELTPLPCTGSQCLGRRNVAGQMQGKDEREYSHNIQDLLLKSLPPTFYTGKRGRRRAFAKEHRKSNGRECMEGRCIFRNVLLNVGKQGKKPRKTAEAATKTVLTQSIE